MVEDERRMAELLRRGLSEEGHQVVVARDGAEGFDIARTSSFDVIVLDVMLPRMDGVTVTKRLREARNQTPVLMLTARDAAPISCRARLRRGRLPDQAIRLRYFLARLRAVSRRGVDPAARVP